MSACPDDVDQELLAGLLASDSQAEHTLASICADDRVLAIVNTLVLMIGNFEGALRAIYADDPRVSDGSRVPDIYHAYRHRQRLAGWALRQHGLVSRSDRSAQALIVPVAGPTSPEYQQVVDRLFEMADELDQLKAAVAEGT